MAQLAYQPVAWRGVMLANVAISSMAIAQRNGVMAA